MKKGQGLSINTIIIAIIALTVLVVLIVIFTGAMGEFVNNIRGIQKGKICGGTAGETTTDNKYIYLGGTLKESCAEDEIPYSNTVDRSGNIVIDRLCCVLKKK